jgi:cytosine/adenosine deaminase-related metal-dependent hydrolase
MPDVVVRGAQAVCVSPHEPPLADAWLALGGGRVLAVGQGAPPQASTTIDARGHLILPGLVSAHHHLFQGASRGVPTGTGLAAWLVSHYARWARMDAGDVRAAAELSLAQLLVRGCTTVAAFEFLHPVDADWVDPVVDAADRLGVRLRYVRGCTPRLEPGVAEALADQGVDPRRLLEPEDVALRRTRDVVRRPAGPRLRWACGPTTPVGDDGGAFQRALNDVADDAGVPVHAHFHPLTPPDGGDAHALAVRLGLVRRGNWLAHGSRLTVADVARLGADGVGVVHCPSTSLLLGYPLPHLAAWREANERVAVGVDGAASNDRGSLLGEAQLAYYTQGQPALSGLAGRLSPEAALDLVTAAGARTIGWDDAGTLRPGALADLAGFDLEELDAAGGAARADRALLRLLRTHQGARARFVLVGGEPVVADGRLLTGDERTIARRANETADRLEGAAASLAHAGTPDVAD